MKIYKPAFWDYKKPNFLAYLLKPFTFPILLREHFKKNKVKVKNIKTICVGNIYLGGTGKTPTTIMLNEIFKNLNYKTCFIKKFYTNQKDEQLLLKKYGTLFCEKERITAIKKALKNKINIAILDDGLQDKSIDYDLKFVCFNTQKWVGNGFIIPAGPMRESLDSLKNYHGIFLNGNGENTNNIKRIIKKKYKNIKIFESKYTIENIYKIKKNKKYVVFSGIGNPAIFNDTLRKNKIKVIKNINFPDHHNYSYNEISKIKKEAIRLGAKILTTEKDFLRLNLKNRKNIYYAKAKLSIINKVNLIKFLKINL